MCIRDSSNPGIGGASKANAGHIGASDIFPLSVPGIHFKALKMLMDSDAPLKVPFKDFWSQIPWFWKFLLTSHGSRFQKATDAISFLGKNSLKDTKTLLDSYDLGEMVDYGGCAFIYDTKKSFNSSKKSWDERSKRGFSSESLNEESIAKITPTINEKFKYAYLSHHWAKVSEPKDIVLGLADSAKMNGVYFREERVNSVSEKINSISVSNVSTGTTAHVSVWRATSGVAGPYGTSAFNGYLAYQIDIPPKATISILGKSTSIYLNEGHQIIAVSNQNSTLRFTATYEVIS